MKYRLGVDIGGTSVKIAALDSELKLTEKRRFPTGESCTSEEIMQNLIEHCREFIEKYDVEAIGVGSAGGIDPKKGLVVTAGNLPFRNEPVVQKLHDAFGIPVFIDNDGNCALVGERAVGECKGCVDTLILTLGTGVGGAVIMDNRIMRGRNNRAGELGHFTIDRNGPECECGLHGCLERYVSATALIESVEKAVSENPNSILAYIAKDSINGKTAFDAKEQGCEIAAKVLDEYGRNLAIGVDCLTHIFSPETIVIAGGISNQGSALLELIAPHRVTSKSRVVTTSLHGDGGIIGAALLGTEYSE